MNKKSAVLMLGALSFAAFLCGAIVSTVLNAQSESLAAPTSFLPPTFSFLKNLKLGDNNQDVRQLQIALNGDADTRVSVSGIGSSGQESTYFGQLTANAVMRFQAKNNISATGFVGVLTRAKLNQIIPQLLAANIPSVATSSLAASLSRLSGPLPLAKEALPRLYTVRPQQIKRGESFVLVGAGFEPKNTIHIGDRVFTNVLPQDDSNISFTLPGDFAVPNGAYDVWVENSKGTSKIPDQPVKLFITDSPQAASVISSVLPATVSGSETVTITGTGFASSGNDIVSGFGTLKNLSSNGTQITFSPMDLFSTEVISRIGAGQTIKVDFYVVNASGASNVYGSVNLKL
jgi:hypothetical protein